MGYILLRQERSRMQCLTDKVVLQKSTDIHTDIMCGKNWIYTGTKILLTASTGVFGCTCSSQHKCGTVLLQGKVQINLTKC